MLPSLLWHLETQQLLQPLAIEPDDHLAVDDDDWSGQVAKPGELLDSLWILDHVAFGERYTLL